MDDSAFVLDLYLQKPPSPPKIMPVAFPAKQSSGSTRTIALDGVCGELAEDIMHNIIVGTAGGQKHTHTPSFDSPRQGEIGSGAGADGEIRKHAKKGSAYIVPAIKTYINEDTDRTIPMQNQHGP
ncbi:hypothetical protein BU17DRAFT_101984 [Hysterangium stoloniferum]|nr:hypothetical protein BU17DRAFT_101984 [Hysterangium stoloniferum]